MNLITNGVTFNIGDDSYHTYDDFNLILENCVISPAEAKVYTIDVPGRNGKLDVTASITRSLVYQNRTITLTLRLKRNSNASFLASYSLVQNHINGKRGHIILDDDKGHYYVGRINVDSFQSSMRLGTIVIACDVEPFKLSVCHAGEDWLWDPFSFYDGVIYPGTVWIDGSEEIVLPSEGLEVSPSFHVTGSTGLVLQYGDKEYNLPNEQTTLIRDITLTTGETTVTLVGDGFVQIIYEGGAL